MTLSDLPDEAAAGSPASGTAPRSLSDGESHTLDVRWISYRRHVGWVWSVVFAVLLLGGAGLAVRVVHLPSVILIAALLPAAAAAALSQAWPRVAWRYASYRLTGRTLEVRRGVLWRRLITVPRSRIQHSDVSQGPLERRYGLGTLSIFTAGTAYSQVQLNGLDHQRALEIRDYLMHPDDDDVV